MPPCRRKVERRPAVIVCPVAQPRRHQQLCQPLGIAAGRRVAHSAGDLGVLLLQDRAQLQGQLLRSIASGLMPSLSPGADALQKERRGGERKGSTCYTSRCTILEPSPRTGHGRAFVEAEEKDDGACIRVSPLKFATCCVSTSFGFPTNRSMHPRISSIHGYLLEHQTCISQHRSFETEED